MKKNTTVLLPFVMLLGLGVQAKETEKISPGLFADAYECVAATSKKCNKFSIKLNDKHNVMGVFIEGENRVLAFDLDELKIILNHCPKEKVKSFDFDGCKIIVRYSSWLGSKKSYCVNSLKKVSKKRKTKKVDLDGLDNERASISAAILENILRMEKECKSFCVKYDSKNGLMGILLHDINRMIVYNLEDQDRIFDFIPYTKIGDFDFEETSEKTKKEKKDSKDKKAVNKIVICYADSLKSKQKYDLESGDCVSSKTFFDILPASS